MQRSHHKSIGSLECASLNVSVQIPKAPWCNLAYGMGKFGLL